MNSIKIGLLHSQTGTMAISEAPLIEAEQLAIKEINANGGVLGQQIEYIIEDGQSAPEIFMLKAEKLITDDRVSFIFGGWNSHSRKAVKAVVEKHNVLFWNPVQYEGLEQSENIFYLGSCPNQQFIPAIDWCLEQGWKNYFLLGSDYIFPIIANKLIHSVLQQKKGNVTGERYFELGHEDFGNVINDIISDKPDAIINTLNGDSNKFFFNQLKSAGITSREIPVLSTSIAEREFKEIGEATNGHFACWNYFQNIESGANKTFVRNFKDSYGHDKVVSDPVAMAYSQLFIWKKIVEGVNSFEVDKIKKYSTETLFDTPAGGLKLMPNHHFTKKAFIGKSESPGEFSIAWQSTKPIEPLPWLGVEKIDPSTVYLIKEVMSQFPEIINFNSELEKQVNARIHWLQQKKEEYEALYEEYKSQNEELVIAKEKAEESNKLKTAFFNNMSHEIRTPLNGIVGFAGQLDKIGLSRERRNYYVSIIQNCSNQLLHIINEILEVSKLETKQVPVNLNEICINDLLMKLFSIFDIKAKENKIPLYLSKSLSDKESTVITDEIKLNIILSNLLENAFKFTKKGYIEFGYKLKEIKEITYMQFYVKDTGVGIKEEMHQQIFDRFAQEEKELSRHVGGLGLGLSIAKENTILLGGNITLESTKGEGAVFYINVPYKPVYSLNLDGMEQPPLRKNVLIVEDEEINYLYLETLMNHFNSEINIIHAKDGKEAIEMCEINNTDLILMDIKMPVINGYDATKYIKKEHPELPIVAHTAYASFEDRLKALDAGCDDYISKPIKEEMFYDIVSKYLTKSEARC